jgi:hypothetical protein
VLDEPLAEPLADGVLLAPLDGLLLELEPLVEPLAELLSFG